MATVRLLSDAEATPEARAVFDDIRATRGTDHVNNFWRALAADSALLKATWERLKTVMGPCDPARGGLDPLTREMLYIAVSIANSCTYCVHSHTASAKAKGMTEAQHADLLAVVAMASQANALATALQVPVDAAFDASGEPG